MVSINTATALEAIYGSRKAPIKKSEFYEAIQRAEGGATTFTVRDEGLHATKRRLLSHAFSERAIQDSEPYVSANVNIWLEQLGAGPLSSTGWTAERNIATWINYLTFDILTHLAYGRSFELLTKNDMRFASELLPNATFGVYNVRLTIGDTAMMLTTHLIGRLASSHPLPPLVLIQNTDWGMARRTDRY